jgi:hypothetical protein
VNQDVWWPVTAFPSTYLAAERCGMVPQSGQHNALTPFLAERTGVMCDG